MTKKILALFLAFAMIFALCACGKGEDPVPTGDAAAAMTPGVLPSEIPVPEALGTLDTAWDADGDALILSGRGGSAAIGCYDTLSGGWTLLNYDEAQLPGAAALRSLSASEGTVWVLLEVTGSFDNPLPPEQQGYWLFFCDRSQGSVGTLREIPFAGGESSEASGLWFSGVIALDGQRAILCAGAEGYLVDREMNLLQKVDLKDCYPGSSLRAGGERLFASASGARRFDPDTLSLGEALPFQFNGSFFSSRGRWLSSVDGALCEIDPATGEVKEQLFRWIDAALSLDTRGGYAILENSAGDFYYPAGRCLIRATPGLVKARETLVLGSFGHGGGAMTDREYDLSQDLLNAVIRFNNTNPDYRVELRELKWETEAERNRLLMELATGTDIDILDTAGLPEGSLDSGLLLDLLPYIDADPALSREDFIQPLFSAMQRNGGLYELTPKVSLLGFAAHPDRYPGRESWTAEELLGQMEDMRSGWQLFPSWEDRELVLDTVAKMATAECIDWEAGTCDFESETFKGWLRFVKEAPYSAEYSDDPQLLYLSWDLPMDAGYAIRLALRDDYVFCGLPGAAGSGCYFIPLGTGPDEYRVTCGAAARLGILAAGKNPEAAWQFLRLLLTAGGEANIMTGIPVLKSSFEAALQASISEQTVRGYDVFSAEDAARLRELVYATDQMARCDGALLDILKSEARGYFEGQQSLDEAAARIQSRASLYVAEQMG